jgi:hypothetical protein
MQHICISTIIHLHLRCCADVSDGTTAAAASTSSQQSKLQKCSHFNT